MKNRSQIDFETIAGDVTDDRRRHPTQPGGKFPEGTSIRNDIDCDRWDDRPRQSATADFAAAAANADLQREPTQPGNPLHQMENVVLTPHTASVSDVSDVERRRRVGQEIAAVLQGRMPRSVVNKEVLSKVRLAEPATV